ncbi:MAG: leucine-rich repeat protein [Hungatella sp.]|nr:leucine-rich repeat protein [Hungatella sp.]
MVLLCEKWTGKDGVSRIRVLECRGLDSLAAIPIQIEEAFVTELSPYLFSSYTNHEKEEASPSFWWSDREGRIEEKEAISLPVLKGNHVEEISLPSSLEKVGAYAFYNCEKIKRLEVYSTTLDWGTGVFTGCGKVEHVTIHVDEDRKSCMKEILSELRQTLSVTYLGGQEARLIFSEFFEEAVENTPARILVTNTHGCGKQYRNAFVNTQFQFKEYDSLFPYIQIQESEELAARVALGRQLYPYHLTSGHDAMYQEYLREHCVAAACQAVKHQNMEELQWLMDHIAYGSGQIEQVIEAAGKISAAEMVSYLMDQKKKKGIVKRRRFQL